MEYINGKMDLVEKYIQNNTIKLNIDFPKLLNATYSIDRKSITLHFEDDSSFDLSIPDVENILVSDYQNSITRYL